MKSLFLSLLFMALAGVMLRADDSTSAPGHPYPAYDASRGGILLPNRDELRHPPLTIEAWVKLRDATNFNIIVACDPKASGNHWELFSHGGDGMLQAYLPGYGATVASNEMICDNNWHYIAMTFAPGEVNLYVDGLVVATAPLVQAQPPMAPQPGALAIGQLVEGGTGVGFGCNGLISDVRISKGIRDATQVPTAPFQKDAQTLELYPLSSTGKAPVAAAVPAPTADVSAPSAPSPASVTFLPAAFHSAPSLNLGASAFTSASTLAFGDPDSSGAGTNASSGTDPDQYKVIPAATHDELTPTDNWPAADTFGQWTRSQGGPTGDRYSNLDQINKQNVRDLTVAWTYHSGDGASNIQCNPIIVDNMVILPTGGLQLAAVDGATGKEVWRFKPEVQGRGLQDTPARRGLTYWPGDGTNPPRIIFTMGTYVFELDPKTGKPIDSFGNGGHASIPEAGCSVAPVVYKHIILMPGFARDCWGYDLLTGKQLWTFATAATGSAPGADSWSGPVRPGANCWGGQCLDESRGILYFATGSPKPNFIGVQHRGDNLYSDSLIAIDAETGKYKWAFQEIRHDVWDLDIPAPPFLSTIDHDGMKVDVVGVTTKIGNTILCDRVSGKPIYPFRLRRAPAFTLPGDAGSPYQPDLELPQPFSRQELTRDDVTDISHEAHDAMMKAVDNANLGWFVPFELNKPSIYYGIHGGAEWTGQAVNPQGHMFVTSNNLPWQEEVVSVGGGGGVPPRALTPQEEAGHKIFEANCAMCHGTNEEGKGTAPSLVTVGRRLNEDNVREILSLGRGGMPPQPQLSQDDIKNLLPFLLDNKGGSDGPPAGGQPGPMADQGYLRLAYTLDGKLDPFCQHGGYPGIKPPWGQLTCIDLNTGKIAWQVPLGEYPELKAKGIPKTGTENFGGATVTAGGLVFASGTRDNQIRAFDADTGEELWKHDLPIYGTAPPAVYQVDGREFVVLPVTGGGKMAGPVADTWMAFALPK